MSPRRTPTVASRDASWRSPIGVTSSPNAPVATSGSAWASSKTTTSWSGRTLPDDARCAQYKAWFTTSTSAAAACSRARSAKQASPSLHLPAPGHSRGAQLAARRDGVGDVDVGEIAGHRRRDECLESLEVPVERRARAFVEQRVVAEQDAQLRPAEVLRSTLQQRGAKRNPAVLAQVGKVLVPELVLERERRGRHDDLQPRDHGRNEVREALARARGRLGDEVVAGGERVADRRREPVLARPIVAAQRRDRGGEDRGARPNPGSPGWISSPAPVRSRSSVAPREGEARWRPGPARASRRFDGAGSIQAPNSGNSEELTARLRENLRKIRSFGGPPCKADPINPVRSSKESQ